MCLDRNKSTNNCEIQTLTKKFYFYPRTTADTVLFRNVRLGAAGLASLGVIQFVGHQGRSTTLELATFITFINAAWSFAISALLFESLSLWCDCIPSIIRLENYLWPSLWLDWIASVWAVIGGFLVFFQMLNGSDGQQAAEAPWIALIVFALNLIISFVIYWVFRCKLVRIIDKAQSKAGKDGD